MPPVLPPAQAKPPTQAELRAIEEALIYEKGKVAAKEDYSITYIEKEIISKDKRLQIRDNNYHFWRGYYFQKALSK